MITKLNFSYNHYMKVDFYELDVSVSILKLSSNLLI